MYTYIIYIAYEKYNFIIIIILINNFITIIIILINYISLLINK